MLSRDAGLFDGPRPGLLEAYSEPGEVLKSLLASNEQVMVVTADENVSALCEQLGRSDAVLGIRDAKGLEVSASGSYSCRRLIMSCRMYACMFEGF